MDGALVRETETEPKLKSEDQTSSRHDEVIGQEDDMLDVVKSDNSDGQVNWTWKQIIAMISLCGVYVGKSYFLRHQPCPPLELRFQY